jgi:hypothetical protein
MNGIVWAFAAIATNVTPNRDPPAGSAIFDTTH